MSDQPPSYDQVEFEDAVFNRPIVINNNWRTEGISSGPIRQTHVMFGDGISFTSREQPPRAFVPDGNTPRVQVNYAPGGMNVGRITGQVNMFSAPCGFSAQTQTFAGPIVTKYFVGNTGIEDLSKGCNCSYCFDYRSFVEINRKQLSGYQSSMCKKSHRLETEDKK
jgi:hypothetical protein